ncbi:hypothetical protein QZH41_003703 [Actinostola sp. cb2023]|nr:hypothetical protein QZH41_003703 [Actinostola sp. cb2023]
MPSNLRRQFPGTIPPLTRSLICASTSSQPEAENNCFPFSSGMPVISMKLVFPTAYGVELCERSLLFQETVALIINSLEKMSAIPYTLSCCPGSPGELVVFKRTGGYKHYAVNIGDEEIVHRAAAVEEMGSGDAVDGSRFCFSANANIAVIKRDKFSKFYKQGDTVIVENSATPLSPKEIVRRALSKVGEKGFSVLWKNCEHFARWCRYGEEKSEQADALKIGAGVVLGLGAAAFGLGVVIAGALGALAKDSDEDEEFNE